MNKQIEALKLALDALEYIHEGANNQGPHTGISWRCVSNKAEPAITALRDRLAQPTQEPVAWGVFDGPNLHDTFFTEEDAQYMVKLKGDGSVVKPLYTSPSAQRKPLTPDLEADTGYGPDELAAFRAGWEAAEAAHGIKE